MKNPYNLLKNIGIPIAYMKHDKVVDPPFLVYRGSGSDNFGADNTVYNSDYNYTVEYYFITKDEEKEKKLEQLFNDNEIYWEKSEDIYIPSENMYLINYYI